MVQKFNVEVMVHHLRICDNTYKKGEKVTFTVDEVKRLGQSVKILAEVPEQKEHKAQKVAAAPAARATATTPATAKKSGVSEQTEEKK